MSNTGFTSNTAKPSSLKVIAGKILRNLPFVLGALVLALSLVLPQLPANSQGHYTADAYYQLTRDVKLSTAFSLLAENPSGNESLDIIVNKKVKVIFKNMRELDKRLKDYDALSYMGGNGSLIIFVNEKHRFAPPEAIAAILAHEAVHNDAHNSIHEEVAGWNREAATWIAFKKHNPALANIPEGQHPLVDRLNTLEEKYNTGTLSSFVSNLTSYRQLPKNSPGFGPLETAQQ